VAIVEKSYRSISGIFMNLLGHFVPIRRELPQERPVEQVVWIELYRMLEQAEGEAARLRRHVDSPTGLDRLHRLERDIEDCALLVRGLMTATPGSTAYMRLVGLSGAD
jgi:hypothetical protein